MKISRQVLSVCLLLFMNAAVCSEEQNLSELRQQVTDTERAFAQTMAERDFERFVSYLALDAIFFSGETALRGKQQVADKWKSYYESPDAPFSWEPAQVEVLDSGKLALSTGPVYDPEGKKVATFTSIWRLETSGHWRIVFDKGNGVCDCPKTQDQ